jgi:hypothetical protein
MQSLIRRGRASINGMLDRPLAAGELAWGSCIVTWSAGAHRRRRRRAGRMATSQLPTLGRRRLTSDGRAEGSVGPPCGYERRIGSERLADFKKTVEALVASASTTRRLAGSPPRRHAERRRVAQAGGALDALLPQRPHAFAESQRRSDPHRRVRALTNLTILHASAAVRNIGVTQ